MNFGDKRTDCCITTTHTLTFHFSSGNFLLTTAWLSSPTQPTFLRLKVKLRERYFDTSEVNRAKSQAVLNTLTEHHFQEAIKNGRSARNGAYTRKGTALRVMVASRSTVTF
jgi:hypothetical protein